MRSVVLKHAECRLCEVAESSHVQQKDQWEVKLVLAVYKADIHAADKDALSLLLNAREHRETLRERKHSACTRNDQTVLNREHSCKMKGPALAIQEAAQSLLRSRPYTTGASSLLHSPTRELANTNDDWRVNSLVEVGHLRSHPHSFLKIPCPCSSATPCSSSMQS